MLVNIFGPETNKLLMKKTLRLVTSFCALTFFSIQSSAQWTAQTSGVTVDVKGIQFIDNNTGHAVGGSGRVLKTTNGGSTWTNQTSGGTNLNALHFPDASTGYAVGSAGQISKTTNGGTTWTTLESGNTSVYNSVFFTSATTGVLVGNMGTIKKTTNGGTTWTSKSSGVTTNLQDVFFIDANNGFAVGASGVIRKTTDGGETWTAATSGATVTLYGVHFLNSTTGFVVGASNGTLGTILKTTDGGTTWTPQASGTFYDLRGIDFHNATTGYAVGMNSTIVKTVDGGTTWTIEAAPPINGAMLLSVDFTPDGVAFASGGLGSIITTANVTGMNEVRMQSVAVYPNPFSSTATVEFSNPNADAVQLALYSIDGKLVVTTETVYAERIELERGNLNAGLYFYTLVSGNKVIGKGKISIQ